MRRPALIFAAAAVMSAVPSASAATSYTVKLCHNLQSAPPGAGNGWSTQVSGSAIYAAATPTAWLDSCEHPGLMGYAWQGPGGAFGDTTAPGSQAFVKFVPPSGSTITQVRAFETRVISTGAYAEAGIFAASTGRALSDNTPYLNGDGVSFQGAGGANASALGSDGAEGVLIGARCPSSLPPGAGGYCGGAGASYADLEVTISDPSPPELDASITLNASGQAITSWTARDPQSGVVDLTVERVGGGSTQQPINCNQAVAPPCPTSISGNQAVQLAEGATATFKITAGYSTSKTVSVTRPVTSTPTPPPDTPAPPPVVATTPPPSTPQDTPTTKPTTARVSIKAKALRHRRVRLTGSARGCKRVRVKIPGRKHRSKATVRRGKWTLKTVRRHGTYRAYCGKATARRTVR